MKFLKEYWQLYKPLNISSRVDKCDEMNLETFVYDIPVKANVIHMKACGCPIHNGVLIVMLHLPERCNDILLHCTFNCL